MTTVRRLSLVAVAVAVLIPVGLAGCGGGDGAYESGVQVFQARKNKKGGPTSTPPPTEPAPTPPPPSDPSPVGWTVLAPSADTLFVYVSSSTGSDANNGLSEAAPKATIAAGKALVRSGYPDWLLLKSGDTWTHQGFGNFGKSGRSAAEPMVVSSYGSGARPLIQSGTGDGLDLFYPETNHLFIVGLHFQAHTFTGSQGSVGLFILSGFNNLLVEDCKIEGYSDNIVVQGGADLRLRRSVIVDSYSTASHSQGIYAEGVDGLLIEECVFDRNGWKPGVNGAQETLYNHNIYIQSDCTSVSILGTISAQASSHGLQLRPGGTAADNLFLRNSCAMFAAGEGAGPAQTLVQDNVILDGKDINGSGRGSGIEIFDSRNALVRNNVVAHKPAGVGTMWAYSVRGYKDDSSSVNYAITFEDNVAYQWNGPALDLVDTYTSLAVRNNLLQSLTQSQFLVDVSALQGFEVFENNKYWSNRASTSWFAVGGSSLGLTGWVAASGETGGQSIQVLFPDPTRTVVTYQALQGGTLTLAGFLAEARLQSRSYWRPEYAAPAVNDYIRGGFGK